MILVFLMLLLNFVSGSRLELMCIPLMVNIRSSVIYLHGVKLLLQLSWLIENPSFVCTNGINLLLLKWNSYRLVINAKWFLKLPDLFIQMKQKRKSFPRNLATTTFGELLKMFSAEVNLLYFLWLTDLRCCIVLLTKRKFLKRDFCEISNLDDSGSLYLFFLLGLIQNWIKLI